MTSPVTLTPEAFDPDLKLGAAERALEGLATVARRNEAVLQVVPGSDAAVRLGRRGSAVDGTVRVSFVDREIFADELASYGPEVRVTAPDELRDAVIARLRAVVDTHGGAQ